MTNEPTLLELATRMGWREVPEVLDAAETPIQRGHHFALAAGLGAGQEAVYALAAAQTCAAGGGLQALLLVPSRDRAVEVALAVQRALAPTGIRVAVPPLRADGSLDAADTTANGLVARPSVLLPEVRQGRIHLADLRLLVLDGYADLEDLEEWPSAEPLLDTLAPEVRRVVVSRRVDDRFRRLVERQLPRGRKWPDEVFREDPGKSTRAAVGESSARLHVVAGASLHEHLALLVEAVEDLAKPSTVRVRCREEEAISWVAAALESAGLQRTEPPPGWDVAGTVPVPAGDEASASEEAPDRTTSVWFGLPLSAAALQGQTDVRIAIVDAAHRPQLGLLADREGMELHPLSTPPVGLAPDPIDRYRARVRARIEKGGTDAELLVLRPLLHEFGTGRVLAATSDLLRRGRAGDGSVRPWPDVEAASLTGEPPPAPAGSVAGSSHRGVREAWSRIFVGAGNRDSVRAGDLVGAITGETGIAGAQIGKIDIRGSFSLVEIDSQVVDRVIHKLNGTAIRGRTVTVKRDRGG